VYRRHWHGIEDNGPQLGDKYNSNKPNSMVLGRGGMAGYHSRKLDKGDFQHTVGCLCPFATPNMVYMRIEVVHLRFFRAEHDVWEFCEENRGERLDHSLAIVSGHDRRWCREASRELERCCGIQIQCPEL